MNEYRVLDEIGKGSFGTVYKIERKQDKLIYAMKKVAYNSSQIFYIR